MLDLLVRGGTVVTAEAPPYPANIGVEGGRVVGLYAAQDTPPAHEVLDATGRAVLPGLIDPHVHPGVYRNLAEDLGDLTRFALRGGITSMVAFHRPQAPYAEAIPAAREVFGSASHIDFGFILGVTQTHQIDDIGQAVDAGIRAFKFYLGYCGHEERMASDFPFTDTYLVRVMEAIAAAPGDPLLCVHCENADIARHYQEQIRPRTEHTLGFYDRMYPMIAEADSAVHVSLLGHLLGIRTCIVHVSAGTTAELLDGLPWRDPQRSVLETCMHYLAVTVEDPAGLRAVVRPPVRTADERDRLWAKVLDGTIDTMGSDHCANDLEAKAGMDVWTCTLGFGEAGLTLPLLLSEGHHARGLSLQRIAALTSRNVAVAHGLYPRKGTIRPGADADLVIVDLDREQRVEADGLKEHPDGSVYAGRTLRGWPVATVARGRLAHADGEILTEPGSARFLEVRP
jgi:dihydroorotase-like cyclic amidohydrolase